MSSPKLLVGLGNPGTEYTGTRHNIGFMCLETLASRHGIQGKSHPRFRAMLGQGRIGSVPVLLAQPLTYMNLSGESVQAIRAFYKIADADILIIYDDTALPFGRVRFRPDGSAGSHNGMKSIIQYLGTQTIPRLRVGVGEPPPQWALRDYVLGQFTPEEQAQLPHFTAQCADAMACWLSRGMEPAMNTFNNRLLVESSS